MSLNVGMDGIDLEVVGTSDVLHVAEGVGAKDSDHDCDNVGVGGGVHVSE